MAAPFEMAWIVLKDHQFDAAARARPLPDHPDSPEHGGYYDIEEEEPEEEDSRHLPLEDELDPMRVHQEEQAAHRQVSEGLPDSQPISTSHVSSQRTVWEFGDA
jgi:hypothetical protein